jgi:hypothetical protein
MTATPDIEVLCSDYCSQTTFCGLTEKGKKAIKEAKSVFDFVLCVDRSSRYGLTPHDIVVRKHYKAELWNWLQAKACLKGPQLKYCYDEKGELLTAFAA